MASKLDIEYIEVRNFLSYGDYTTRLDVANLGPVLILGDVESSEEGSGSNGAGKSSLLSAFIWCLFGRTITNPNPGDRVTNWYTKRNCYVKIGTADGWEIIRTRNFDGHSELILRKNGDDETQSTNTNAQTKLKEIFGLDYEIFTSSVFCGQFGKSFLEMSPVKRKETIERLLGLDRLNKFADAAKVQFKQVENRQEVTRSKIDVVKADAKRQDERLSENREAQSSFEEDRQERLEVVSNKLTEVKQEISKIVMPDVETLKKQWQVANAIFTKVSEYRDEIKENQIRVQSLSGQISRADENYACFKPYEVPDLDELEQKHKEATQAQTHVAQLNDEVVKVRGQIHCLSQDISRYQAIVEEWETKPDTNCESCGQMIGPDHVEHTLSSVKEELEKACIEQNSLSSRQVDVAEAINILRAKAEKPEISVAEAKRLIELNKSLAEDALATALQQEGMEKERDKLLAKNGSLTAIVERTVDQLEKMKPQVTLEEVAQIQAIQDSLDKRLADLTERSGEILGEINPYSKIISDLRDVVAKLTAEVDEYESEIGQLDVLFKHYKYIYRSYSDRRKIKSWLLSELIPFLNDRVQYYLDMLDIDMCIKFNSTLNAETDRWDYEFCSGGERKRIDLAIMFGLYDLYMSIYGQQCSIMVLDEVDSRLDKRGVESFTEIVTDICTNDERPRPSTIFVISHKQELESLFPSQITIKKKGNFSSIDQTVFTSE
jgi:DNA repair exonuclease SbcCD ATPase subunit